MLALADRWFAADPVPTAGGRIPRRETPAISRFHRADLLPDHECWRGPAETGIAALADSVVPIQVAGALPLDSCPFPWPGGPGDARRARPGPACSLLAFAKPSDWPGQKKRMRQCATRKSEF